MPYDIEVQGLKEMQKAFDEAPREVGRVLEDATKEAGKEIFRTAVKEAPHFTGNLQRSMHMEYNPIEVVIEPRAEYAEGVEYGTKPHPVSGRELAAWAGRKGLNPWAVANSIKTRGTRANPFMGRTRGIVEDFVQRVFLSALDSITNLLAK